VAPATARDRPPGRPTVWTIGYEGRSTDRLVADLRAAGVRRVVDVRELPMSRKRGFSKSALAASLGAAGIGYASERRLGAPRDARHKLREGGPWEPFAAAYLAHLDAQAEALAEVEAAARAAPTALLCYERDALACHRGLLAARLARHGLDAVHL
jgi:uncharacterized protein (DUF488 family)